MMSVTSYGDGPPAADRTSAEDSLGSLLVHTWVQIQRLLIRWGRDPQTVVQALILPVGFLVSLNLVFGQPISSITGRSALYGSVPMTALVGAVFGSSASAICLMRERGDGLLARLWVLPVHRASGLLSRLGAEAVRILLTAVVVACAGLVLGFRFQQGIAATAVWLLVPVAFGVAFSTIVTTLALYVFNTWLVEGTGLVIMLLVFFCTGFVPLAQYPSWLQPVVAHQPMSCAVDAMRGLSLGGPVLTPLLGTLVWSAGIIVVCAGPMLIGYRKASMR